MAITSNEIVKDLIEALSMFGTYTFDDKGPHEVMDLDYIVGELRELSAKDAGTIMKEVAAKNDRGQHLIDHIASGLDDMPDAWFNEMLDVSGAEY